MKFFKHFTFLKIPITVVKTISEIIEENNKNREILEFVIPYIYTYFETTVTDGICGKYLPSSINN